MIDLARPAADVIVVDPRPDDYALLLGAAGVGLQFQFGGDGEQAVRVRPSTTNVLWLVNTVLPDMSGFELYQLLAERDGRPTVYLVGDQFQREDELRAITLGAALYATKPPRLDWLTEWRHWELLSSRTPHLAAVRCDHTKGR